MLRQSTPKLKRKDRICGSFSSCISNISEKFFLIQKTKIPFSEIVSQQKMSSQKFKLNAGGRILPVFLGASILRKM